MEVDEAALGATAGSSSKEPGYWAFLDTQGASDEIPRVARVEKLQLEQVQPFRELGAPKPISPLSGKRRGTSGGVSVFEGQCGV